MKKKLRLYFPEKENSIAGVFSAIQFYVKSNLMNLQSAKYTFRTILFEEQNSNFVQFY